MWARHAAALQIHLTSQEHPVTAADIYPDLFGPGGRWAVGPDGPTAEEELAAGEARIQAMVERMRAAEASPSEAPA